MSSFTKGLLALVLALSASQSGCGSEEGEFAPAPRQVDAANNDLGDAGPSDTSADSVASDAGMSDGVDADDGGASDAASADVRVYDPGGECDPYTQDCPQPVGGQALQCQPVNGVPTCVPENPHQLGEDESCTGGDCAAGLTCINWSSGEGQLCSQMCDRNTREGCSEGKACTAFLASNDNIGLCEPAKERCDIYAQDCPEPDQACTFGIEPSTGDPIFVCEPAGPNGDGEECSSSAGACQAGFVCIGGDDVSTCHAICRADDDCATDDQTCAGRSATWDVTFCR